MPPNVVFAYLLLINLTTWLLFGFDKRQAKGGRRRVAEKYLFLSAALGGTPGALLGMYWFRHKTKHASFVWGIPVLLLVQTTILVYLY